MRIVSMMIAGALMAAAPAHGQVPAPASSPAQKAEVLKASELRAQGGTLPALLSGPDGTEREALFAKGIQGEVFITGVIGVDGAIHDATVIASSRSSELDAFALDLIVNSKFDPAKDREGRPVPVSATVPVYLWKDSLADGSILRKSCGDFVIDADWYASAFPEKGRDELRGWLMIIGASFARQVTSGVKKPSTPSFETVYDACRAKPERKLVDLVFSGK